MGLIVVVLFGAWPVLAQEMSADTMQALKEKVKADKKLVVSANMDLTEAESKNFWPLYEAYQKDLEQLNQRVVKVIKDYADAYNKGPVPNDTAKKLLKEALSVEDAEAKLKHSYAEKMSKVLPATKVARYIQIENKIRAVVKYELAEQIPLAK
jgi:hypothetical protein